MKADQGLQYKKILQDQEQPHTYSIRITSSWDLHLNTLLEMDLWIFDQRIFDQLSWFDRCFMRVSHLGPLTSRGRGWSLDSHFAIGRWLVSKHSRFQFAYLSDEDFSFATRG